MKTKTLRLISLLLTATLLFGCNTNLPTPVPTPEQAQLPAPIVALSPATDLAPLTDLPLDDELLSPENCQLGFEIPWEHDESNPITDETQIMEILRALGNLEECLFARQDGWLHNFVLENGQRTEEEVLAHLIEGGRSIDLRYDLFYNQGQLTAKKYYDGRIAENQWCNISDDANKQVIQVKRNCKTTEVYHLLTGNGTVDGYVENFAINISLFKKQPAAPGYYGPKAWFIQENDASFFVIEMKYDMSNVQVGEDFSNKPFTDEVRRHFIDLNSGRLTRYVEETGFKDGSFRVTTEDVFLLFYPELPDDIAAALSLTD
ncbi:MAG: hypothetical protein QM231_03810 [Chloroflexota bacterium]|jgi:hypothetical protein|nr:hypothetical protein [Chloroflexota bacterium]